MSTKTFILEIISPEKSIFSGSVELAAFPGEMGAFSVLCNHAPLISVLSRGTLRWIAEGKEVTVAIGGGFVEVKDNKVIACVEPV